MTDDSLDTNAYVQSKSYVHRHQDKGKNILFFSLSNVYCVLRSLKECQIFASYLFVTEPETGIMLSLSVAHIKVKRFSINT